MKCPNCGYFNLPDANVCGRCSRALSETSISEVPPASPVSQPDWAPPRASQRTMREKVERTLSPATRQAMNSVEISARKVPRQLEQQARQAQRGIADSTTAQVRALPRLKPYAQSLVSVVPGAGQWWQGRLQHARELAIIGFAATLFALLLSMLSDWGLLLAVPFWGYSVFDAADYAFPLTRTKRGQQLRRLRLVLLAVIITAIAALLVLRFVLQENILVENVEIRGA